MRAICTCGQAKQEARRAAAESEARRWRRWLEHGSPTGRIVVMGGSPTLVEMTRAGRMEPVSVFR